MDIDKVTSLDLVRGGSAQEIDSSIAQPGAEPLIVERFATAELPTKYGHFRIVAFKNNRDDKEHVAIVKGEVAGHKSLKTRIHSECLTGDVFGSLKCDCGPQLERALANIEEEGLGLILYMRQEGRGIGLANKVAAYSLQDRGFDTVEANLHLGFDDDLRRYDIAAEMIKLLGVEGVELLTNNPRKVEGLVEQGIDVIARSPIKIPANEYNLHYLRTKRDKSGHIFGPLAVASEG